MNDPTLIADLIRAGVDPDLVARVSSAMLCAAMSGGKSAESPVDISAEKRRAYDRERKRVHRNSGGSPRNSADVPSALLKEERKIEGTQEMSGGHTRAKGSRLPADWTPSKADIEFASSRGMARPRIDNEVEKFRNYWTAKAGRAAVKLDWSATWRNWILQSLERHPPPNGTGGSGDSWLEAIR